MNATNTVLIEVKPSLFLAQQIYITSRFQAVYMKTANKIQGSFISLTLSYQTILAFLIYRQQVMATTKRVPHHGNSHSGTLYSGWSSGVITKSSSRKVRESKFRSTSPLPCPPIPRPLPFQRWCTYICPYDVSCSREDSLKCSKDNDLLWLKISLEISTSFIDCHYRSSNDKHSDQLLTSDFYLKRYDGLSISINIFRVHCIGAGVVQLCIWYFKSVFRTIIYAVEIGSISIVVGLKQIKYNFH